ncbi:hypothetical protein HMPREF9278_0188, partial [Mobiluncus mulieris FB024-16]|uniref:hypothetical protein n=1 Tax=Mobiluncus mulieris TaxID=2052 RepID=UPI0001E51B34
SKFTNAGDTDVTVEHGKNSATGLFLYDGKAVNNDKLTVGQAKGATGATAPTVAKSNGTVTVNATSATPGKYTVEVKYADGDKKGDYTVNITVTKATLTPPSDLVVTVDKNTASGVASSDDVRVKFKKVDSGATATTASDVTGVTVEGTVNDGKLTKLSNDGKFDDADFGKVKVEYEVATGKLKFTGASSETKTHAQKTVTFRLKLTLSADMSKNYADTVDVPVKVTTSNF